MKRNIVEQMELGFNGSRQHGSPSATERKIRRAAWWFARVRSVVNHALDWEQAQAPRPEQTWLVPQR